MKRITIAALGLVVGATAGCRDMGLEGNIPAEEARTGHRSALMAAISAPTESDGVRLVVEGRLWVPSGLPLTMDADDVRSVGSADGQTVYARQWDRSPYDALFIRQPRASAAGEVTGPLTGTTTMNERWLKLEPVRGRSGAVPGGEAGPAAPGDAAGHH